MKRFIYSLSITILSLNTFSFTKNNQITLETIQDFSCSQYNSLNHAEKLMIPEQELVQAFDVWCQDKELVRSDITLLELYDAKASQRAEEKAHVIVVPDAENDPIAP